MTGSFYAGRAADIPATTFATPARTGTNTGWTAANLDRKAAHEISHCLDQQHVAVCGNAPGGQNVNTLSNGSTIVDVAFDIPNNRTITGGGDLMSYCNTRWTHPDRWARVFNYVGG